MWHFWVDFHTPNEVKYHRNFMLHLCCMVLCKSDSNSSGVRVLFECSIQFTCSLWTMLRIIMDCFPPSSEQLMIRWSNFHSHWIVPKSINFPSMAGFGWIWLLSFFFAFVLLLLYALHLHFNRHFPINGHFLFTDGYCFLAARGKKSTRTINRLEWSAIN